MRHQPWWLGVALLAGATLVACQEPANDEIAEAERSAARIPDAYTLVDLGTLPEHGVSYATAINNRGEVAGISMDTTGLHAVRSFYYTPGQGMVDLGVMSESDMVLAHDLNNRGQVTGTILRLEGAERAFVWEDGTFELIEPAPGGSYTRASAINNRGQVVGGANFAPNEDTHAFLYDNGQILDLGTLQGGTFSLATDINRRGDVAGIADNGAGEVMAVIWEAGGEMIDIGSMLEVDNFVPFALGPMGQLAGWSPTEDRAYFVDEKQQLVELGTLQGDQGSSWAFGMNRDNQVVGGSTIANGDSHAFIWEDGQMVDLNDRLLMGAEMELIDAVSINNRGQIVGVGRMGDEERAFLLTPTQAAEPLETP